MVSSVCNGSCGDVLKRLRSQKCGFSFSRFPPKVRPREVSAVRDFPKLLSGFGRNIEQKSNRDHASDQDDCCSAKPSEPDRGLAWGDIEYENVEIVSQGSALTNAFADEEFVAQIETSKHENADTIDKMRIMNRMTMNVKVDDGGYPELGDTCDRSIMGHVTLPKRCKVPAVRDFPDAFQQCNGQNGSQKKAIISSVAGESESGEANCASDFEDFPEPIDTDFVPLRSTGETQFDLLRHNSNLDRQGLLYAPGKEEVLKLAADLADLKEGVESITPLAMFGFSDWEEKAEYIIPLAIEENDHTKVISQTDAAEKPELENDGSGENFDGKFQISKQGTQNIAAGRAYVQLKDKTTSIKTRPALKIRKVSAVRDFPVAFTLVYAGNKWASKCAHIMREKDGRPDSPPVNKPVTHKTSLRQGKVENFQEQHLGSKESEHRIIVQAVMAAPRCPWSSKKSQGSNKRKCRGYKGIRGRIDDDRSSSIRLGTNCPKKIKQKQATRGSTKGR